MSLIMAGSVLLRVERIQITVTFLINIWLSAVFGVHRTFGGGDVGFLQKMGGEEQAVKRAS